MLDETQARERILESLAPCEGEEAALIDALGRFSAGERRAEIAVPGFDNSAMDGYALWVGDGLPAGARLALLEAEQPAGRDRRLKVGEGEALRIFTGAPLPEGAHAVIMQEDVTVSPDGRELVLGVAVARGEFVRRAGSDVCLGQILLRKGDRITPARCGLLASQGWATQEVGRVPGVTVVTTGDELLPVGGSRPGSGELYNSNGPMLTAMVRETCGRDGHVRHRHAGDNEGALSAILREAMSDGTVVIVSGGVSVGTHDLVKPVLGKLGVKGEFWRVRVKPGKPFYFGRHSDGALVFGLPGNPVSSFVTFILFVAPALRRIMGACPDTAEPPRVACRLAATAVGLENAGDRPHYIRGRLDGETGDFLPLGLQQSHAVFGLSEANALLRLEAGEDLPPGGSAVAIPLGW